MKILFIVNGWPPMSLGGVEVYTRRLARRIAKEGHEVSVFCREADPSRPDYVLRAFDDEGVPVTAVNHNFRDLRDFRGTYLNPEISRIFDEYLESSGRPDVAHIHHLGGLGHDIAGLLHRRGVPIALSLHDFAFTCPRGQRLRDNFAICETLNVHSCADCLNPQCKGAPLGPLGKLYRRLFRKSMGTEMMYDFWASSEKVANMAEVLIAPGEHHARVMERDGYAAGKIRTLPYGYDKEPFERVRKRRQKIGKARKFGYLGSLIPSKGVHLIIDAAKRLKREQAELDIEIHIYGPSPSYHGRNDYEKALRQKSRGLDVTFHGPIMPEETPEALAELDAVIVPSLWWESHGMVVREAQMAGKPVIASAHGALGEAIRDGITGLLFRPGNVRNLRDKMYILAQTPGLADAIAQTPADVLSIDDDARAHLDIYHEISNKNRTK